LAGSEGGGRLQIKPDHDAEATGGVDGGDRSNKFPADALPANALDVDCNGEPSPIGVLTARGDEVLSERSLHIAHVDRINGGLNGRFVFCRGIRGASGGKSRLRKFSAQALILGA